MTYTALFSVLYPISAIITLIVVLFSWINRKNPIVQPFILLMIATTIWTVGDYLITRTTDPVLNYIIGTTIYPAVVSVPVAWFLVVLSYTGYDNYLTLRKISLLFVIPAMSVLLVVTNPVHYLFYTGIIPEVVDSAVIWHYNHGPLFLLHIIYSYILVLFAFILIISRLLSPTDIYRRQTYVLFIASFVPFACNIIYVINPGSKPTIDLTPFSFTIVGLLITVGIIRYQLFTSVPLAYSSLFSSMHDGVFATDITFRIIDLNPAAIQISGRSSKEAIGVSIHHVMPDIRTPDETPDGNLERRQEIIQRNGEVITYYEVSDFPLSSGTKTIGWIFTVRNISKRKQIEADLQKSQDKLQLAISGSHIGIWEYDIRSGALILDTNMAELMETGSERRISIPEGSDTAGSSDIAGQFLEFLRPSIIGNKPFFEGDLLILKRDGGRKWMYIRGKIASYSDSGYPIQVIGTSLDISDRRNIQDSLEKTNNKLNLLSSITRHDILNQVTGLQGYLGFALEEISEGAVAEYLVKCQEITKSIQSQIEFTRFYQRIGANTPKWQNITQIVKKGIQDLPSAPLVYHIDLDGVMAYADPLLEKVFFTLIENSVRHGEHATEIRLSYRTRDDTLTLTYEDNGTGVEKKDKSRIFLKHFGKNTGFGLFLAQEILSITGMSIREDGVPGEGVRFRIDIPAGAWRIESDPQG